MKRDFIPLKDFQTKLSSIKEWGIIKCKLKGSEKKKLNKNK